MSERPRLLDAFSGAGGAARGYQLAGFHVTGVDIRPQPRYVGDAFVQGDAIAYIREHGHEYDAIHASPPCQAFTRAGHLRSAQGGACHVPDLIAPTRAALVASGRPWVIENVAGAPLLAPQALCGSAFGLRVRRHRLFEMGGFWFLVPPCRHREQGRPVGVYHRLADEVPHGGRTARTLAEAREAMGIAWMEWDELKEAIPPAYTSLIGAQLRRYLESAR